MAASLLAPLVKLLRAGGRTRRTPTQTYCPVRAATVDVEVCATCGLRASESTSCTAYEQRGGLSDWDLVTLR
jgi:hypothetical protein